MHNRYFITASGTNIGKTLVTCSLTWQLKQRGIKVKALKPIISGFESSDAQTDTAKILQALELPHEKNNVDAVSPWRFKAPLSPNMAAQHEGKTLTLQPIIDFCTQQADMHDGITLVEGVGGVYVPINDHDTVLDWMQALTWPTIMVTGSYLGAISHTLTAIECLKQRSVPLHALIVSESEHDAVDLQQTIDTLKNHVSKDVNMLHISRITPSDDAYKAAPDLSGLCI